MLRAASTAPRLFTLVALTAISVAALNMFIPSLEAIADEFGVSYAAANSSISIFLALSAVLLLILGPISDRIGRRPVILFTMAAFTLSSLCMIFAPNFTWFMALRMVQAVSVAGMGISRATVRDTSTDQEASGKLAIIGMAMAIVPMLGPAFGGLLQELYGWRANFIAFTLAGAVMFWLTWVDFGETHRPQMASFADQFRAYPDLFRSRRFWGYTGLVVFSVGVFYAYITAVPVVASEVYGLPPSVVGLSVGIITLGFIFGNMISRRAAQREVPFTVMMMSGRIASLVGIAAVGLVLAAGYNAFWVLCAAAIACGFGNGLSLPSGNAGVMSVRPDLAGSAAGLSGALVVAVGAGITWVSGLVMRPEDGEWILLSLITVPAILGFLATYWVILVNRREARI